MLMPKLHAWVVVAVSKHVFRSGAALTGHIAEGMAEAVAEEFDLPQIPQSQRGWISNALPSWVVFLVGFVMATVRNRA